MKKVTKGIDVSSYQPDIDFSKVKGDIDFAILRAGYTGWGSSRSLNKDTSFERHYKACKEQGIPVGCYYYSCVDSIDEARREATYFLKLINGKKFEYPIYIDIEDSYHSQKLSTSELTKVVKEFATILEQNEYYVGIYANAWWWRNKLDMKALSAIDRWVAHYGVSTPAVKGEMWQHTDTGKLKGYKGNLDLNYCYKNYPSIIKGAGLNGYDVAIKTSKITIKGEIEQDDGNVEFFKKLLTQLGFDVTVTYD